MPGSTERFLVESLKLKQLKTAVFLGGGEIDVLDRFFF